jgi:diaminopimelate epimerase
VRVDMGVATVSQRAKPIRQLLPDLAAEIAVACGPGTTCSTVDVGNPHLVLHCDRLPGDSALALLGPRIEHHNAFPNRTNAQFVVPAQDNAVLVRTWERGSGITQACGTGACAVAASLLSDRPATLDVALPGGVLTIDTGPAELAEPSSSSWRVPNVRMTGPAAWVFDGVLPLPLSHSP